MRTLTVKDAKDLSFVTRDDAVDVVIRLMEERDALAAVLDKIVGQKHPNKWGYDAASVAMDDEWRAEARATLNKVRGL